MNLPTDIRRRDFWRAHVPCTNEQHDPANGLIAGLCVRCRTLWPCEWSPEHALKSPQPDPASEAWGDREVIRLCNAAAGPFGSSATPDWYLVAAEAARIAAEKAGPELERLRVTLYAEYRARLQDAKEMSAEVERLKAENGRLSNTVLALNNAAVHCEHDHA